MKVVPALVTAIFSLAAVIGGRAAEPGPATKPSAPEMTSNLNLRFAEIADVDSNLLSLDVYSPKVGEAHPVVIYVHGGSWRAGDKSYVGAKAARFTREGCVFVSVNYRLSPAQVRRTPTGKTAASPWTQVAKHPHRMRKSQSPQELGARKLTASPRTSKSLSIKSPYPKKSSPTPTIGLKLAKNTTTS